MSQTLSVLFVSALADDRRSTEHLEAAASALRDRGHGSIGLWFLRPGTRPARFTDAAVVDSLRTWTPAAGLDRIGLRPLGDRLRGMRLRRWFRAIDPDVIVLDDALGERVIPRGSRAAIVHRRNPTPPILDGEEPPARIEPRGLLTGVSSDAAGSDLPTCTLGPLGGLDPARAASEPGVRAAARSACGLPAGARVLAAWPQVLHDPTDLLAAVASEPDAFGLWADPGATPTELAGVRDAAGALGVRDRVRIVSTSRPTVRLCADAAIVDADRTDDAEVAAELAVAGLDLLVPGGQRVDLPSPDVYEPAGWADEFAAFARQVRGSTP